MKLTKGSYEEGKKVIIHKGGTGSGKTTDLMVFLFWLATQIITNKVITVVSESRPHLDIGCIRIAKSFTNGPLGNVVKYNESKSFFTFPNNNLIEFFSADRIDKALGARRYLLYGNEINSLKLPVWDELARRSEIVIGDFNPISQFWLEEWIRYYDDAVIHTTNYMSNPFLPETERRRIEKRAKMDQNFKRIHIDCEYGIYEGLVFESWKQVDELPEGRTTYGLDFGFTNDPSALIKVVETDNAYYLDEVFYRTGLLNREIASLMEPYVKKNYDEVIADSAEPKSIEEIRQMGYNIKPSVKGPDSVRLGIDRLKSKDIYVTKRSVNLIRELRNYSWVTDKNGQPTNKPVDAFNHAIDAVRYAISEPVKTDNWVLV